MDAKYYRSETNEQAIERLEKHNAEMRAEIERLTLAKELAGAAQKLGRKGGKARAKNLTSKQRSEAARKAAAARWAKRDERKEMTN